MSIETLESLLKNPEIWDIELSTQNMRDVLLEIAARVDNIMSNLEKNKRDDFDRVSPSEDMHDILTRINALSKQCDRQNTEFGSEIKELKAFFNFQLKDMRERMDRSLSSLANDLSRPSSPPTPLLQELPEPADSQKEYKDSAEINFKLKTMSKDISHLKDKIRNLITLMNDDKEMKEIKPLEIAEVKEEEPAVVSSTPNLLAEKKPTVIGDIDSMTSHIEPVSSTPIASFSTPHTPEEPKRTSRQKRFDPRFEEIKEVIDGIRMDQKANADKINSTIKAVNSLITDKDNQTKQINQCLRENKAFSDEFDRLYQKMAELHVDVEKRLDSSASANQIPSAQSSSRQPELPDFNAIFQKMKESFTDNLTRIDGNYRQQIHSLKVEVSQLKQALSEKMLLPSNIPPPSPESIKLPESTVIVEPNLDELLDNSRPSTTKSSGPHSEKVTRPATQTGQVELKSVEVQTSESLLDGIPTHYVNVELQHYKVANIITTMPILDRDPIRFVPQRPPKKEVLPPPPPPQPRTVKRPRKNVNLTSHEVQTNKEQGQPDANPPEEEVRSGPNVRFDMGNKVPSGTHSPTNEESSQASEPSPNKKKRRTKKNYVDLATDATEENEGMFSPPKSPSKTPPKTPKHRAEMVDSAIETDAAAATPLNSKRTTPSSTPKTPLSPSKRENESIIGGESDQEKDKDKENVNELDKEEPNEDETKENDNKDENKEEMKEEKNEEAKTENEKDEEKRELKDDETETTQSKENEEKKEEDKSSKEQNEKREGDENKRNKISKRRDKSKKYADSETSTNDPEDSTTSTTSIQTTQSKDDNKEKKEHAKLRPKGKKPQLVSQGAGTENENEKKSKENEYEYEYEDEDKPRLVSHGITTDDVECGNADEEDEYEDEVMIVDVYVQTDDVDNDDLVLNVDEMGDMEYMEQYATNPVQNSSISVGSSVYHKYQPPRVFGLEHLLSLSIISEVKASEPQQIVVKIPEATSGEISQNLSRDDISSLIQKALEAQNHTNYNSLKQNIDENTNRIAEIVNTLNQMQGGEPVELINTTQSKEIIENLPKVTGSNIKASNASGSVIYATVPPQPKKIISQLSKPTLSSTPNIILVDCKPLTNPSPSSTDKNNEDKPLKPVVVNYVDNTKSAINNEAVELLKERLDKFELSVSALESQFYDLEKTIINTGAMRPNSAIIDDDKPFSSHLYSRIQHRSPLDGSPVNTKRIIPSDFTITPSKEGSHHKHHKHHSNRSSKIDLAKIQNKLPQQTEQINEEHEKLFDDEPQESEDVALIPFQPSSGNLGEEPTPNQNQGKTYYTQYIPGQQSAQVASEEPKVGLQFIGGFSIDPDFDITQKTQPDTVFDPEDLTISKYERQFRLLREAVVELRTDIQILKVKSNQPPPILPYSENAKTEQKDELETEKSIDESTLRNLRRKIDLKLEDYESQISEIRRELYEHLNKPPEKVVEIVKEIHTITKPPEDEKEEVKKEPPPPPKDINVELNLVNAIKMLSDTQHKNIISIHKLELPPEVPEHSNPPTRQPIIEKPPTEQVYKPSANIVHNLPPPTKDVPSNDNENAKPQDFPPIPPPAPTPLMQREPNVGHEVPQIVKDMRVLNAMPKKDMLELLMPFLYELRSELMINIDSNTERIRCIEDQIGQKVEKEFIDTFFRKIRVAVQDADSKATKAINSLVDKITSEDLENRIQELIRQMGAQETTVAGKTNFTCLFCGSKKSTVSKVGGGILDRGKIFKGRATRQSLPTNEASQLPPLSEDE